MKVGRRERKEEKRGRKGECFFFPGGGGIRDLIRSRGLGDLYKGPKLSSPTAPKDDPGCSRLSGMIGVDRRPVSYNHLTLQTKRIV